MAAISTPQSTSALTDAFLKAHPAADSGSRFVTDLYAALQGHLPLTLFQEAFIFVVASYPTIPYQWKVAVFSYLYTPPGMHFPILLLLILAGSALALFHLIRHLLKLSFSKAEPFAYLELVFPSVNSKSAYATEQLFSLLHALAGQRPLLHRLMGYGRRYSLELTATREEGIRYILAVAQPDLAIIEKGLLSYLPGIQVKQAAGYSPASPKDSLSKTRIVELRQTKNFALSLASQKLLSEHDPIAYLAGNMTKLKEGERITFQVVAIPANRSIHPGVMRSAAKLQRLIAANQPLGPELSKTAAERILAVPLAILLFILKVFEVCLRFALSLAVAFTDSTGSQLSYHNQHIPRPAPGPLNAYEEELHGQVKEKLGQELFITSLRLFVQVAEPREASGRITGFLASLGSLASPYQSLAKATGFSLLGGVPIRRRFEQRQLSLFGNPVLSSSELCDLYHFPYTTTTKTEDLVTSKSQALPAPLAFKQTTTQLDTIFALNNFAGSETPVGLTLEERRRHMYILGASGSGKTTLLSTMIQNDIRSGKGVCVIDPHGQLVEQILGTIPSERLDDVIWFAPDDDQFPIALNLLELQADQLSASQLQKQKSLIASSINSIFQKFYDAKYFGPRMEYILRNAVLTALETPSPTLTTVQDLLTKTKYRKEVVATLQNKVLKDFWVYEFEKLGSLQRNQAVSPITNKIGGLLSSPINYAILNQAKSTLDFDAILNNRKILLCDISKGKIGEDETAFFGSLIIAKLQLAALKRVRIPEQERRDFFLYVDEFQNFATGTFAELVSEARKYHLGTILAHQSISQIENRDVVKVILANVGTIVCFKTANPEDEQFILPVFSPEVSKHDIGNLSLYHFYMKISVSQAQNAFMAKTLPSVTPYDPIAAEAAIARSRSCYARAMRESQAAPKKAPSKTRTKRKAVAVSPKPLVRVPKSDSTW